MNQEPEGLLPVRIIGPWDSIIASPHVVNIPGASLYDHHLWAYISNELGPEVPPGINGPSTKSETNLRPIGDDSEVGVCERCSQARFNFKRDTIAEQH